MVQCLSKYFIDLERVIRRNRICIYGTDECKISLKKHTHAACHCFFVLLIFLFQHTVNKRTMSSKRLMGCDNSLESANGAADQQDWRQKFFFLYIAVMVALWKRNEHERKWDCLTFLNE
jgi:hypothetical protein